MATIEDIQNALDSLNTPPPGLDITSILPGKETIMKGLLGKSIPAPQINPGESVGEFTQRLQEYEERMDTMVQQASSSFFGAQVDMEMNTLKCNLISFMTTVPSLAGSIVAQITTVAANPVTLNCVPSLISGIKAQLGTLTLQATQILNSCLFLGIELPDAVITTIQTLGTVKTALDAIPI